MILCRHNNYTSKVKNKQHVLILAVMWQACGKQLWVVRKWSYHWWARK